MNATTHRAAAVSTGTAGSIRPPSGDGRHAGGFSLVEVLVAAIAVALSIVILMSFLSGSSRSKAISRDELLALAAGKEMLSQLRIMPWTVGYDMMYGLPYTDNPPPVFPKWISITADEDFKGAAMPPGPRLVMQGMSFLPESYEGSPVTTEYRTDGWKKTGRALYYNDLSSAYDPANLPRLLAREASRLHLSPIDEWWCHSFQIVHPPRFHPSSVPVCDPDIFYMGVAIHRYSPLGKGKGLAAECRYSILVSRPDLN